MIRRDKMVVFFLALGLSIIPLQSVDAFLGWGKTETELDILEQAKVWLEQKRYPKAIRQLEKIIDDHPDNVEALANLGYGYFWLGDYRRAEIELKQAINLDPDDMTLVQRYIYTLHKLNRLDEAYGVVNEIAVRSSDEKIYQNILSDIRSKNIDKFAF